MSGEGALSVFAAAKELERQGRSIIHLELGEPDFHPAAPVVDALKHAVEQGKDRYCPVQGLPALQQELAKYLRENTHQTIIGSIAYSADGEWKETATLEAQFRGIADKNVNQFRSSGKQVILFPDRLKTGDLIFPFEDARK